jgi:glycosyltransferase involved in cell wall biosynthesis
MRVLHIITDLNRSGAETVLFRLISSDHKNDNFVISLMDMGEYGLKLKEAGITVKALNMPRGKISLRSLFHLYSLIRSLKPDVIQTWMYHADLIGGFVGRLAGKHEIVWGIRASDLFKEKTAKSTLFVRWLCARASKTIPRNIIVNSQNGQLIHANLGYDKTKMVLIHNGLDTEVLKPDEKLRIAFRKQNNIEPRQVLIGAVGRWDPQKDYNNFIASLGQLKQIGIHGWRCILVGPGITEENTELLALLNSHELRRNIDLLGPRNDIVAIMNALDLHVLSSSYGEGFPNVLAEAMSCGTPCVTTEVGDAAIIVGETGWVVPTSNSVALAMTLQKALGEMGNIATWEARKQACRSRIVKKYSLAKMVESYSKVWSKVRYEQQNGEEQKCGL